MRLMPQDAELEGHVLSGIYRLVRRVGEATPSLYEARHPRLAGRFAARIWPSTVPVADFRQGAEIAAALRHPGAVQVIDFNATSDEEPFLITEWVEGTPLSELLAASGLLDIARVAAIVESAAWALAAAHQQGVVHQELHLDRIIVVQAPGTTREWTKVDGFGLDAALVRVGAAPPSPYRAPEQSPRDDQEADPQSDQFALAAIAYEMLSGVPPFDEATGETAAEPAPLPDLVNGISLAVDAVIRQALAREPEQRFPGVLEFARALRDAAPVDVQPAVRTRKPDAWAPVREPLPAGVPVSPFFNPVDAAIDTAPPAAAVSRWRRVFGRGRVFPKSTSARVGTTLVLLLLAFGGLAAALRPPPKRTTTASVATDAPGVPKIVARTTIPTPSLPPEARAAAAPAAAAAPVTLPADVDLLAVTTPDSLQGHQGIRRVAAKRSRLARGASNDGPGLLSAPVPAVGGSCVLSVSSRPPAEVFVDDHRVARRTPLEDLPVPCGEHKVVLRRDDLSLYQMETVTLRPGTPFRKSYRLR